MNCKALLQICLGLFLLNAVWLSSQVGGPPEPAATGNPDADNNGSRMLTPPPVSGQVYPAAPASEERSNYLRGGLGFTTAYTDNALGSASGQPVSDTSFSVAPFLALDETTSRLHWVTNYAPGFTFYRRISSRNEADENVSTDIQYRLSPHLTFNARDGFQKSSTVFNQPDLAFAAGVPAGAQEPNFSVIAPIADRLSNAGNVGLNYQFAANGMVGATGTFSNLHYPNPSEVPGLYDSSSQGGSVFYSLRLSKMHYLGATYQYQRLVAYPTGGSSETQTHAVLLFYTLYATSRLSMSLFGGPQHSDTVQPPLLIPPLKIQLPEARSWTPSAGGSMNWQGSLTSIAVSYSHTISGGGGLTSAVHMDNATAAFTRQMRNDFSASAAGSYVQNDLLASALAGAVNGHTLAGTVSLQQQFKQHFNLQLGYTRLHQSYAGVAVLATAPDTNREFISINYQFSRPLGR
jgi:hypothetical protein